MISSVTSPYAHTGLTNGVTYYYVVTVVNAGGESAESAQVSASPIAPLPPDAPTGITATAGNEQATVSWESVSGATSYNIYWSTNPGVTSASGTLEQNVTSPFTHTGLANGTTYYYVVTAVNDNGESEESAEVTATPTNEPPPLP
jgi:fibronectin type 3 domain-containing protein